MQANMEPMVSVEPRITMKTEEPTMVTVKTEVEPMVTADPVMTVKPMVTFEPVEAMVNFESMDHMVNAEPVPEKSPNKRHGSIKLEEKVSIITEIQSGKKQVIIARERNIPKTTIQGIWSNRQKILSNFEVFAPNSKRARKSEFPHTDAALLNWLDTLRRQKIPINGSLLLEQAKRFAVQFGETEFKGTYGWMDKWKKRHCIKFNSTSGEANVIVNENAQVACQTVLTHRLNEPIVEIHYCNEDLHIEEPPEKTNQTAIKIEKIESEEQPNASISNRLHVDNSPLLTMAENQKDDNQVFGDFVASELRNLSSELSRKKLKRQIQKVILQVSTEDAKKTQATL